ncbi:MAG: SMP-30/gluconolactonase/LRE family protein [Thermomicrobiales bacterium]|nr:SMP-30/gluconolactonase/LRE family protein [Thermomicrobiales bacterium]
MTAAGEMIVLASGFDTLEGPAFDRHGNLFFVDWERHSILRRTPDGEVREFYNTSGIPAGLAFHPDGSLWVADEGEHIHGLLRITPDAEANIIVNEYQGKPLNGANDLVFDKDGNVYFSDPWETSAANPVGGFYRYTIDGELQQLDTGLAFPNGVALTHDGQFVMLAETYRDRILRYRIDPDGAVGPREVWANTSQPSGGDGMAFAEDGNLYVAHHGAGAVDIFDPTGKQVGSISVPGKSTTNCAFGGPNRKTLVITECETGSLYAIDLDVSGQPLHDGFSGK